MNAATRLTKPQLSRVLSSNQFVDDVVVSRNGELERLGLDEVAYFKSEDKRVFAGLNSQEEVFIDQTLKELEALFKDNLIRVHRSALINTKYLARLYKDSNNSICVKIKGSDASFTVSRRHAQEVKRYCKNEE